MRDARNTYSLVQTCRGGCDPRCHLPLFVQQQLVLRALLMNQTLLLCNQFLVRRSGELLLFVTERTALLLE